MLLRHPALQEFQLRQRLRRGEGDGAGEKDGGEFDHRGESRDGRGLTIGVDDGDAFAVRRGGGAHPAFALEEDEDGAAEEDDAPKGDESSETDAAAGVEDQKSGEGEEETGGLPDGVTRGREADVASGEHGERPSVHGDVLGREQGVDPEEDAGEGANVGPLVADEGAEVPGEGEEGQADEDLEGQEPGSALADGAEVHGIHDGGPQDLKAEGPRREAEDALLGVTGALLLEDEADARAQAHGDALQGVQQQE